MVPISHPVRRSVVTNIAGSIDATLTGNGGTPIADADVVGGLSTKTIAFAAGETLKYATWDLVDDAAVEGTEGYKVTLSNPQPSGTISAPSITGTVLDNDSSGGEGGGTGKTFGPTDGNNLSAFNTEVDANYVAYAFQAGAQTLDLFVGGSGSTISRTAGDSVMLEVSADDTYLAHIIRGGVRTQLGTPLNMNPTAGQEIRLRQNDDNSVDVLLAGVVKRSYSAAAAWPTADRKSPGTWGRLAVTYTNAGFVTKAVTIGPVV